MSLNGNFWLSALPRHNCSPHGLIEVGYSFSTRLTFVPSMAFSETPNFCSFSGILRDSKGQ